VNRPDVDATVRHAVAAIGTMESTVAGSRDHERAVAEYEAAWNRLDAQRRALVRSSLVLRETRC
jgi:hypothetical protein